MLFEKDSIFRRGAIRWVDISLKHPWICATGWVVLTALAILIAFGALPWISSGLKLKTDLAALLPPSYDSVRELDRIKQKVSGLEKVIIVVQSPDSAKNMQFILDMADTLSRVSDIGLIEYDRDMSFFEEHQLLYIEYPDLVDIYRRVSSRAQMDLFSEPLNFQDIRRKYQNTESTQGGNWATPDGTLRLMKFFPSGQSGNIARARDLVRDSYALVEHLNPSSYHPDMQVYVGGEYKNRADEYDVILSDIISTAALAIIGIIILISLYFKQPFAALYIGSPLIMGLSWTFGITTVAIGNLNLVTGFLVAVLAGLGIDFGIHVFSRYIEERGHGLSLREAVTTAVLHTGAAITTSATTTVAAFYSLMITDFKGFSEFGFIAGTGVIMTLAAILLTFPAFIAIGEKLHLVSHRHKVKEWKKAHGVIPFDKHVLVFFGAAVLGGLILATFVSFDYDFTNLRANLPASIAVKQKINLIQRQPSAPAAIVCTTAVERGEIRRVLEEYMAQDTLTPTIKEIRTIEGFLPDQQHRKLRLIRRLRRAITGREERVLEGQAEITPADLQRWLSVDSVSINELPDFITRQFRGPDGSFGDFLVIGTTVQLRDGKQAIEFAEDVRTVTTPTQTYYSSGSAIIFADMLIVMSHDSVIAVSVTFLVVLAIVLMDFGSRRAAIIALSPLVLDLLGMFAAKLFGIDIDLSNTQLSMLFIGELLFIIVATIIYERKSIRTAAIVVSPVVGGIILMLGAMYLVDLKLNFYNMVVLPSIIGMGIDNGVHLYHRYLEEGRDSLKYVMRTTGAAVFMASITTMVGFSGMVIATHQGLNSMGDVAIIGILACLAMSVVGMPVLLSFLERKFGHPEDTGSEAVTEEEEPEHVHAS